MTFEVGHDIAPEVGGRGIAVLKHDGGTLAYLHVRHFFIKYLYFLFLGYGNAHKASLTLRLEI